MSLVFLQPILDELHPTVPKADIALLSHVSLQVHAMLLQVVFVLYGLLRVRFLVDFQKLFL